MATPGTNTRIPNLPSGKIVNEDGTATTDEENFRRNLVSSLQSNFGSEGCVVPSLSASDIIVVQNNTKQNPSGGAPIKTCAFGTIVYNSTAKSIMISIDDGAGNPLFKTVTLT